MSTDRRQGTATDKDYTGVQQRKRIRCTKQQDGIMSDRQCISLLPTSSDNFKQSPPGSPWKGWKTLSNESSPNTAKENQDFPPLTTNPFDSWFTPEPITNWADFMDEEETQKNKKLSNTVPKKQRFKRKLLLSENGEKSASEKKLPKPILTDEHRLAQRQKQIDYGKNTAAYGRYVLDTPRHCRHQVHPRTPDKFQICSTRSWSGQIKSWRRKLHEFDPPTDGEVNLFSLHLKRCLSLGRHLIMVEKCAGASADGARPLGGCLQYSRQLCNAMSDVMMKLDMEECGSITSSNSSEDFFKDLNIDACLQKDPLS